MDLQQAMMTSASGLHAQSVRMRTIAENLANADTLAVTPGGEPYRRKLISFSEEVERATGAHKVMPDKVVFDKSDFGKRFEPGHPGADADGYVLTSNVNGLIEMMDMQQAQRSYEANVNALEAARHMASSTLSLLR